MPTAEIIRELAEAIAGDECRKDIRRCKLRTLKALYLGCSVDDIICDLWGVADPAVEDKLREHRSCRGA